MNAVPAGDVSGHDGLTGVAWHISTRSSSGGQNCVEAGPLADRSGRVAVRDSRDRDGGIIVSSHEGWAAFVASLKVGAFDLT
ncbi:MAG: DUF397 domain-containing protein [Streptosporangiaceae bacterium]